MARTLDIQNRLISLVSADTDMAGLFTGTILADDPNGVKPAQSPLIAITLAEDDFMSQSLGGAGLGSHTVVATFGIHVYVADPGGANDPGALLAAKTQLVETTDTLRETVWKFRSDIPASDGTRLWYQMKFRVPATKYLTTSNFRKSTTYVDLLTWSRNR